jgi:uncharacterized protein YegJ (DUF2314 family)
MEWLIGLAIAIGAVLLIRRYYARPEFPPLPTDPDDPLLAEARAKARATLEQFRSLYPANKERALAKIRFVTSGGTPEYLWGEVKNLEGDRIELFLVTPPVTHEGRIERLVEAPLAELEDWQITDSEDRIFGGFTQRAMFKIARQRWGKLPKKLQQLERLYPEN